MRIRNPFACREERCKYCNEIVKDGRYSCSKCNIPDCDYRYVVLNKKWVPKKKREEAEAMCRVMYDWHLKSCPGVLTLSDYIKARDRFNSLWKTYSLEYEIRIRDEECMEVHKNLAWAKKWLK